MKKWSQLERVVTPSGSVMTLMTHDGHYVLQVDGRELMSTRHPASEEKLGEIACSPFSTALAPKVLIGGLGLGFTLRSALACLPQDASVVVAELIPEVVQWNKNPQYKLAAESLADPRTKIAIGDVGHYIAHAKDQFDAIMLDADNGTTPMNSEGNQRLYEDLGLEQVRLALKPKGLVVYWSAQSEPVFAKRMVRAKFDVEIQQIRSHAGGGGKHTLLLGRKK